MGQTGNFGDPAGAVEFFEGIVKGTNSDRLSLPSRPNFRRTMLWQLQCRDEQQETIGYHTLAISFPLTMPAA